MKSSISRKCWSEDECDNANWDKGEVACGLGGMVIATLGSGLNIELRATRILLLNHARLLI